MQVQKEQNDQPPATFILNATVAVEETRHYEFKEVKGLNPVDAIKNTADEYVVAFLNSEGGRIYWGIRNSDRVVVGVRLNLQERDKLRRAVSDQLMKIQPPISPTAYRILLHKVYEANSGNAISDLFVVEVVVPSVFTDKLYFTGGRETFAKTDAGKKKLTPLELQDEIRRRVERKQLDKPQVSQEGFVNEKGALKRRNLANKIGNPLSISEEFMKKTDLKKPKWLEIFRRWVGEEAELSKDKVTGSSKGDRFYITIARRVGEIMEEQTLHLPGGTYLPPEYIIFLSSSDSQLWQGKRHQLLEDALREALVNRAKELTRGKGTDTDTINVELSTNPSLEPGKFDVHYAWDKDPSTIIADKYTMPESDEEPTTSLQPTFSVSVRRLTSGGAAAPPDLRTFFNNKVMIGRSSRPGKVDLRLAGDQQVGREHALLVKESDGKFILSCRSSNSIRLDSGFEIRLGKSCEVKAGQKFYIGSYELNIDSDGDTRNLSIEKARKG